jgi:beta-N-acetylhexosaminidase
MVVSLVAGAFIDGLAYMGMASVGKHFPGHGYVQADSHIAHPLDDRTLEAIMARDIEPYRYLASKLTGVMTAHVIYPRVDESIASYSSFWLKNILRKDLGYAGVIFSDDLVMSAANQCALPLRVQAALGAGCNVALICNDREGVAKVLDSLKHELPRDIMNLSALKGKHLYEDHQHEAEKALSEIGSLDFLVSA